MVSSMEVMRPNLKLKDPVTSRIKILAKLNIAEKRLPQDGRIKLRVNLWAGQNKVIDYRVSILPTASLGRRSFSASLTATS